jgi:hypothetical protein
MRICRWWWRIWFVDYWNELWGWGCKTRTALLQTLTQILKIIGSLGGNFLLNPLFSRRAEICTPWGTDWRCVGVAWMLGWFFLGDVYDKKP